MDLVATQDGNQVRLSVPLVDGGKAIITLPMSDARVTGLALLEVAHLSSRRQASLFDASPAVTAENPPIEVRCQRQNEVLLAVAPPQLGAVLVQLDKSAARELRDALTLAIGA